MTEDLQAARRILQRRPEQNAYPLLRIHQGLIQECLFCGQSVCLVDSESGKYLYAVGNETEFYELYSRIAPRGGPLISLVSDDRLYEVVRGLPGILVNRFHQLQAGEYDHPPEVPGVRFEPVREEMVPWMLSVYEHPELNREFILRRAAEAPSAVAFAGGRPVGFFMTHSAAEAGPVYVDPAMRGSGLSEALYARVVTPLCRTSGAPVLWVREGNASSCKYLTRVGCKPAPQKILWFYAGEADCFGV